MLSMTGWLFHLPAGYQVVLILGKHLFGAFHYAGHKALHIGT